MNTDNNKLWYTRREGEVSGPYNGAELTRHILLGRINDSDELSSDGLNWQSLSMLPELIPEIMRDVTSEEDRQHLMLARLQSDERMIEKRESPFSPDNYGHKTRRIPDRRQYNRRAAESEDIVRRRYQQTQLLQGLDVTTEPSSLFHYSLIGIIVGMVLILSFWYRLEPSTDSRPDCTAAAQANINWSYCRLEGAQLEAAELNGANLSHARLVGAMLRGAQLAQAQLRQANLGSTDLSECNLREANLTGAILRDSDMRGCDLSFANLSYAQLQGAKLDNAILTNTRLNRTIWTDGRICGADSLGICRQN